MSGALRKVKIRHRKNTLKELLEDEKKRIRFYFLLSGVLLVVLGFLLPKSPKAEIPTPVQVSEGLSASFSQEPVKVDKTLTGKVTDKNKIKDSPIRILIEELKIDLPVKDARVINGYWQVFADSAAFGLGSAYPDEFGNQVIFAHAREGLFLPLRKAKIGQKVTVFTKDRWYAYKIKEIKEVLPNQIEVIAPTKEAILTLYTCSGFSDSKRLIVIAERT